MRADIVFETETFRVDREIAGDHVWIEVPADSSVLVIC
jgi:hypothetical protein